MSRPIRSYETCELGAWKGLQSAPESCKCLHHVSPYRSRRGIRCKCCFGQIEHKREKA